MNKICKIKSQFTLIHLSVEKNNVYFTKKKKRFLPENMILNDKKTDTHTFVYLISQDIYSNAFQIATNDYIQSRLQLLDNLRKEIKVNTTETAKRLVFVVLGRKTLEV